MKLNKAIVSTLTVATLLATTAGSIYAHENDGSKEVTNESHIQNVKVSGDAEVVLNNLILLEEYVVLGDDGLYYVKEELKDLVDQETYDILVKTNRQINEVIKAKKITFDENEDIEQSFSTLSVGSKYYENYEYYWWGTHYILNRSQADLLSKDLRKSSTSYAYLAIATALAPEGTATKVISAYAGLFAAYHNQIANDIDTEKTRYGVYLDLDWTEMIYNVYSR
ncbi:hypothetical protein AAFJ72_17795 [Brevibacillus gelatini]|uniref:hypothetical protein n=1 Tax=Brevibacillus gelatini TaxID=1655277 RepID=UPI003D816096